MNVIESFNPDQRDLWTMNSEMEWVKGNVVRGLPHPGQFAKRNGYDWLVPNQLFAETMVKANREVVQSIIGALYSWQICTVEQLQAGLALTPVPKFDRAEPNIYGALCRLGAINVGFSARERYEGVTVPHVWLSLSNEKKIVNKVVALINADKWVKDMLAHNRLAVAHPHARHNTYAAHVGLAFRNDPRSRFVGGDGWARFSDIDARATSEAGIHSACATDVISLNDNNVLAGIEVQTTPIKLVEKAERWSKLLAFSPMQRRGLVCVWLFVRENSSWCYPSCDKALETVRGFGEMTVGTPSVAMRTGIAYWDDWFDAEGQPTPRFGAYTDMAGHQRTVFDPQWKTFAPTLRPLSCVTNWGWPVVQEAIMREWGWDVSRWTMPEAYRGGFYGFAMKDGDES